MPIADISEANGWFISYPGGQRQEDPSSVVALPGGTPGAIGQNPGLTYVRAQKTWVPVPYEWVAPDGATYVYEDFSSGTIYAVAISGGSSRTVIAVPGWSVLDAENDGVYVTRNLQPGVWFIPYAGGPPRQLIDHGSWLKFGGGALWSTDGGHLTRHDVASGVETSYAAQVGVYGLVGFDNAGNPIVLTSPTGLPAGSIELTVVRRDASTASLWSATGISVSRAMGDQGGIWWEAGGGLVGAPGHGLYRWTAESGAQLISTPEANLAGRCG